MIFVNMDKIAVLVRPVVPAKSRVNIFSAVMNPVMTEMVYNEMDMAVSSVTKIKPTMTTVYIDLSTWVIICTTQMETKMSTCTMVVTLKVMSLETRAIQRDEVSIMMSSVTKIDMKVVMRPAMAT